MQKLAPKSYADLLANVPGIHVESTGGEVQNITRLRGIPTDRGYIIFQQDGLPLFHEIDGHFFNSGEGMHRFFDPADGQLSPAEFREFVVALKASRAPGGGSRTSVSGNHGRGEGGATIGKDPGREVGNCRTPRGGAAQSSHGGVPADRREDSRPSTTRPA